MAVSLIWRALAAIVFIASFLEQARAETPQSVPALTAHVIDQTGTLDARQQQALEQQLTALEQTHGSQVAALMVPTTAPEDIASYSNRVANTWKIGRRTVGDGVLVVVAKNDRKMRLEVAKALEGAIPDIAAARIIDSAMKPRFREGDFSGGLQAAVSQIQALIAGEALPKPSDASKAPDHDSAFDWGELAIFLFLGVGLGGPLARGLLGNAPGSLLAGGLAGVAAYFATASVVLSVFAGLAALIYTLATAASSRAASSRGSGNGGGGGWSSGSSDSGGFSSGGGGDFGGGGASGDW